MVNVTNDDVTPLHADHMASEDAVASLHDASLDLRGETLHYLDAGEGPAILFVHGLLGSAQGWAHLVDELEEDFRVVAPDLFGHGGSAKPIGDYSVAGHAATLRDLLDRLGVEKATLVGHSLGGGIALEFTYLFPERVERLVLVASGGLGRELSVLLRAPTLPGMEFLLPLVASRWVRNPGTIIGRGLGQLGWQGSADAREAWRGFVSLGDAENRRAFLATARASIDAGGQSLTALPHLENITVPTLVVWGARDRLIPPHHALEAGRRIPGSRVEVFEQAGHFPHLDEPDRFARVLRRFITAPPRSSRARRAVRRAPAGDTSAQSG